MRFMHLRVAVSCPYDYALGLTRLIREEWELEVAMVSLPTTPERNKAEDLFRAIEQFQGRGYAQLKGVILNARGVPDESALVQAAAEEMGTQVIIEIPRDIAVQFCEEKNMTVVQGSPDSSLAQVITGWLR
ncbi:Nitrogenase iron protein [Syntrophaceticus schinkii]|jgi:nitrogenase iron protein NifH|uniref:Nitrogenase iron protein n=2 Tax=Syntrophaceticus schinkii TaxID=499207 RepID=A0A0B7MJ86_9FIRM|nr:Nitrogenase iron protein [Syntrophaceticus schinkii]